MQYVYYSYRGSLANVFYTSAQEMCRSSLIADVVSKENREKNSNIDWELGIILSLYVLIIHTRS